jgi:pyrimidine deaminase RibD-like protein
LDETAVFNVLLDLASTSKDPEGVVAACLVRADVILEASASSDDGHYHAEYLLIQRAAARGITIDGDCVVYTTLEPCSNLPTVNDGVDCTTLLIEAGLRHVVFAASDPEHSATARVRFDQAGGTYRQVEDPSIIRRAVRLFNKTLRRDLSSLRLPRRTTLGSA